MQNLIRTFIGNFLAVILTLIASATDAKSSIIQVQLNWTYKNFSEKMKVFNVIPLKSAFISETATVSSLAELPVTKEVQGPVDVTREQSKTLVLVVENKSDNDIYFFAVPHEVHPSPASAGHFFECLCVGKVYKIEPKKFWYRIVRINLNSSFQNLSRFDIEHQIIGLTELEFKKSYQDRLYKQ